MKSVNKSMIIKIAVCSIAALIVILLAVSMISNSTAQEKNAVPQSGVISYEESYEDYLTEHGYQGDLSEDTVEVDLSNYKVSEGMTAYAGEQGIVTEDKGTIEWNFRVEKSGFYNLKLGYIALPGTTSDIQRKVYIDGELPYESLSQVVISRYWTDGEIRVKNNNEIRPEAGMHTISFEAIKEPLEYTSLTFCRKESAPSYGEAVAELKNLYSVYSGGTLIGQAERKEGITTDIVKSSSSINIQKNYSDSRLEPYHPYHILYNTIGAEDWSQPGDSISWIVEVEQEGLYELSLKGRQNMNRGVTSYRRVYINGEVPYAEMMSVGFAFQTSMNNYTLVDENGEPYLFHLKAGTNTITFENVMGPMGGIITQVEESMSALNSMYLKVVQLTGQSPSKFID